MKQKEGRASVPCLLFELFNILYVAISEKVQHSTIYANYLKAEKFTTTKETVEKAQICIFFISWLL